MGLKDILLSLIPHVQWREEREINEFRESVEALSDGTITGADSDSEPASARVEPGVKDSSGGPFSFGGNGDTENDNTEKSEE